MTARTFGIALGAVLFVAGFLFLLIPASTAVGMTGTPASCGSALAPDDSARLAGIGSELAGAQYGVATDDYSGTAADSCASALGTRRGIGWPLVAVGAVVGLGAAVIRIGNPVTTAPPAEVTPQS